ncbi:MAG: 3-methyladenine DNA glycosylase [Rhodothermales bacterium]
MYSTSNIASSTDVSASEVLTKDNWLALREECIARLEEPLRRIREQRRIGLKDPIADFLFEYYSLRPTQLEAWSPGCEVWLDGEAAEPHFGRSPFEVVSGRTGIPATSFPRHRVRSLKWILAVLRATNERRPFFGCAGLHEWAMVYGDQPVRHPQLPLRMSRSAINTLVDDQPVVCTHFDAFRFFTTAAQPLNKHQPTADSMIELEQPGCLHTNMDIYRWAGKLYPWIGSDVLADAFLFALRIREVDMRASPYDVTALGFQPICVETPEGRREYRDHQEGFHREGRVLRARLIREAERLLALTDT